MTQEEIEGQRTHPVVEYLGSLVWDGIPRIDSWLIDFAVADDSSYVRAASRAMLVAAVRRIRHPGCKFGHLPILIGPQGCGKSRALRLLAGTWFTSTALDLKDAGQILEATEGSWIVEMCELREVLEGVIDAEVDRSSAPHRQTAALKVFLECTHDEARLIYQRSRTRVPRQFVVIGTTCELSYLEVVASRRVWPIRVGRFDLEGLAEARDQLWAEAAVAEAHGESIVLAVQGASA